MAERPISAGLTPVEPTYAPSASERPISDAVERPNGSGIGNVNPPTTTSVVEPPLAGGEAPSGRSGSDLFLLATFALGVVCISLVVPQRTTAEI